MKNLYFISIFVFVTLLTYSQGNKAEATSSLSGTNVLINDTVYLITGDGQRLPYTSEGAFLSYTFNNFAEVKLATADDISLPIGNPVPPRDGTMVCSTGIDAGNCYLMSQGKKVKLVSLSALNQLGYKPDNAIIADVGFVPEAPATNLPQQLPEQTTQPEAVTTTTPEQPHPTGSVINIDGTVYYVGINGLLGVPDMLVLNSWGYDHSDIRLANNTDRQKPIRFLLNNRFGNELRPFEPVIPEPLQLKDSEKFSFPLASGTPYTLTESWLYSTQERKIHGYVNHGALDFAVPKGTPIYAVTDGYAIASTHFAPLERSWNGQTPVGFGLGEFVQIWHPQQKVYTSYSHMAKQAENIPYYEPTCDDYGWCDPKVIYNSPEYIMRKGKFIKRGELVGYAGDSGLALGYNEQPKQENVLPSWDEVHLHFEVYTRNSETFGKARRYDPYGVYGRLEQYPGDMTKNHVLWQITENGAHVYSR